MTVASVFQVVPSADHCRSALLCGVPVEMMCCQEKRLAMVASMTMPAGEIALQDGVASVVETVTQADVAVRLPAVIAVTIQSTDSSENVSAGMV